MDLKALGEMIAKATGIPAPRDDQTNANYVKEGQTAIGIAVEGFQEGMGYKLTYDVFIHPTDEDKRIIGFDDMSCLIVHVYEPSPEEFEEMKEAGFQQKLKESGLQN